MFRIKSGLVKTIAVSLLATLAVAGCTSSAPTQTMAAPTRYTFWPAAPDEPRIQYLLSFNNSLDIAPPQSKFDRAIYGDAVEAYSVNKPYSAHMWNGCIYVCDVRATGVMVMDLRKLQTRIMGATGPSKITRAVDMAIAPDGTKYVVDAVLGAILVYGPDERHRLTFNLVDANPVGIALFQDRLYVADFKGAMVRVLDAKSGVQIGVIGERGGEDGQFVGPLGVAVDAKGDVYVSDTITCRVQKFSPDGKFILGFGQTGNRPGMFVRPKYLSIGSDDHIHVVDAAFNNVQVFDPQGLVVGYYGGSGMFPGAMDLPAGIQIHETDFDLFERFIHPAFQAERLIIVANQFGPQKVSVYAMGQLKPGKTVADTIHARAEVAPATVDDDETGDTE